MNEQTLTVQPVVAASSPYHVPHALRLAEQLQLDCVGVVGQLKFCEWPLLLYCTDDGVQLQQTGKKAPGPVWADFVSGAVAHRRKFGGGSGQMIAKAVGIKSGVRPTVLDATAGLGKDSFVLATLGCDVTMVERSPIVHTLLADGLYRAQQESEIADIVERLSLLHGNAAQLMAQQPATQTAVVYLDPMFPHSDKSAQVKKEMRLFRDVVGADDDASQLLDAALEFAKARVVVKRPRKAPTIEHGTQPTYQVEGKSSRYDIYTLAALEKVL